MPQIVCLNDKADIRGLDLPKFSLSLNDRNSFEIFKVILDDKKIKYRSDNASDMAAIESKIISLPAVDPVGKGIWKTLNYEK
jgi:hypothetical protein